MPSTLNILTAKSVIELGRELHKESKYRDTPFDEERCWKILDMVQVSPKKMFLSYDPEFRGFIIMQASAHYFSGDIWTADLAFYVKPEHRGNKEVAPVLIKEAEEWSRSIGAQEMTIFHNTGIDDGSERFFNRNGFETAGYIFTKGLT